MSHIDLACFPLTQKDEAIVATDGYSWPIPDLHVGVETADGREFLFFGDEVGLLGTEDYKAYAKKYQVVETAHLLWNRWQRSQLRKHEGRIGTQQREVKQTKKHSLGAVVPAATKNFEPLPEPKPTDSTSREIGPFLVDEVQYNDGSLHLEVSDNSLNEGKASVGCHIPPEQVGDYRRRATNMTNGCVPAVRGGQFCFDILDACEVTFYRIYDVFGNFREEGVVGGIFTYEDYKKHPSQR